MVVVRTVVALENVLCCVGGHSVLLCCSCIVQRRSIWAVEAISCDMGGCWMVVLVRLAALVKQQRNRMLEVLSAMGAMMQLLDKLAEWAGGYTCTVCTMRYKWVTQCITNSYSIKHMRQQQVHLTAPLHASRTGSAVQLRKITLNLFECMHSERFKVREPLWCTCWTALCKAPTFIERLLLVKPRSESRDLQRQECDVLATSARL